jgi:hypothetical protein
MQLAAKSKRSVRHRTRGASIAHAVGDAHEFTPPRDSVNKSLRMLGASVLNPKFAMLRSTLGANFGFDKDTGKLMILVSFMAQKFARWTRGEDGANF